MAKKSMLKGANVSSKNITVKNPFLVGYRLGAIQGRYDGVKDIAQALSPTKENLPILETVGQLCTQAETWFKEFSVGMNDLIGGASEHTA